MNALSPAPIFAVSESSELSEIDPQNMVLFNGYHHSHHASTLFIRAHALRNEPEMRDHYHQLAMAELDVLAEALGLELVPRQEIKTR